MPLMQNIVFLVHRSRCISVCGSFICEHISENGNKPDHMCCEIGHLFWLLWSSLSLDMILLQASVVWLYANVQTRKV